MLLITTNPRLSPPLIALMSACIIGCSGPMDASPSPAGDGTETVSPVTTEASPCSAAAAYLQACGAPGIATFEANCTEELAEEFLELGCGELPVALHNAGLLHIEPTATPGAPTVVGSSNTGGFGGWFACQLGFKFACPTVSCQLEPGITPPTSDEPCIEWLRYEGCGACEYYRCREEESQCGADGYLVGYVGKYCDRFATVTEPNVSPAAAEWLQVVRECLVSTLEAEAGPDSSCEEIEAVGIASHATCYVEAGFCSLSLGDWFDIIHTIDPGDVPLQQVLTTGHLCLKSWAGI